MAGVILVQRLCGMWLGIHTPFDVHKGIHLPPRQMLVPALGALLNRVRAWATHESRSQASSTPRTFLSNASGRRGFSMKFTPASSTPWCTMALSV